jgi:molybdopterin molybdotransferase
MISTHEALNIILNRTINLSSKKVPLDQSLGLVLAQNVVADRDFPPYDRVTMDGIAICFEDYEKGCDTFKIENTQYAGSPPIAKGTKDHCIEIMTGAILHHSFDTVIRYEDLEIKDGWATIGVKNIIIGQNIHSKGRDAKKEEVLVSKNTIITSSVLAVLATVGIKNPEVYEVPNLAIIATGDELIGVEDTPEPHQIRGSNVYAISALLSEFKCKTKIFHIEDNPDTLKTQIGEIMQNYKILIFSGGVSMGKKDFLPQILTELGVKQQFHKISQKPGKPFWFGTTTDHTIFALPGNPVSTIVCTVRYIKPWFKKVLGLKQNDVNKAILAIELVFKPNLTGFVQVKLTNNNGQLLATPIDHNGSGDFLNLTEADAFLEIPASEKVIYYAGEIFEFHLI